MALVKITNLEGPKGEKGDRGPAVQAEVRSTTQVPAGEPASVEVENTPDGRALLDVTIPRGPSGDGTGATDADFASEINTTGSATRTAVDAASVETLDTAMGAIVPASLSFADVQAACDRAALESKRAWVAGALTTDQTLIVKSDCDLGGLTINYTGSGVAVQVGTTGASLFRKQGTLPRVKEANNNSSGSWVDTRVGIQLLNNDSCVWFVPSVQDFGVGLDEVGDNRGHAYNTITIGHLANNKVNHRFRAIGAGWANQNTHIGGRFGQNSGEGVGVTGSRHVQLVAADANAINNNTWVGSSFEGNTPEFHADVSGTANMFINCRWESSAGPKLRWNANAVNNQVLYGYGSNLIAQTHGAGATRNHVLTAARILFQTSFGVLYESSSGNTGVADAVMGSGGIVADTDPATGYAQKRTANATHMKRPVDAHDRARLDHVNGRLYLGNGVAEPTVYVGVAGASTLRLETGTSTTSPSAGAAGALPATPAGYMDIYVAGGVRKIPYY